jgi:hypothetical protein
MVARRGAGRARACGCLAKAEGKFDAAIVKAEAPAGCVVNGDGATIAEAVDGPGTRL